MQIFPQSEVFETILVGITTGLGITIITLFIFLLLWRLYFLHKSQAVAGRKKKNKAILFDYLEEKISPQEAVAFLASPKGDIAVFSEICAAMIRDLEGALKERIQELLASHTVQNYHKRKLLNDDIGEVIESLKFYKHCRNISPNIIERIKRLVTHHNEDISYMAALVLVRYHNIGLQYQGLKTACSNSSFTKLSILELLMNFTESETTDVNLRGRYLLQLIKSENILPQFRYIIIRHLGERGYQQLAPQLYLMLRQTIDQHEADDLLICALIETLGRLYFQDMLPILRKIIEGGRVPVRLSAAQALGEMGTDQSIKLLERMLNDTNLQVKEVAAAQLLKIGQPVLHYLDPGKGTYTTLKKSIIQEIKETPAV